MSQQENFVSHLVELRDRLLRAVVGFLIVFVALMAYPGAAYIFDLLALPIQSALPEGTKMIATGVITPFMVPVKLTAMVAFVISLPILLYQAWAFIAPGLYQHEKKMALPIIFSSTVLFLVGIAFCHFIVFGKVFAFINDFAPQSITPAPDIEAYMSFVLTMFMAFGMTFEVPIVVVVLVYLGVVTVEKLVEIRGYVIVAAFVIAAIVTPPDVMSQLFLAIPICILYEVGILFAKIIGKQRQQILE
ncbi:MAG: twin-arginine translocase subunit TatC [Limnobacter sp.]|jgi:sec-independent protein translocase protein TatC|uniref:Sec-independent protein translocase protein TatC n=1 Tax=Limnobacter profundi TaxID=2732163 RepID=A0ABX6NB55_9BURK|nr:MULTISPECIES: twin-arginine translocase subunit TatC [unclassified Limnobacter]MAG79330.1 twin-arginine translocase subunit TatC [Sutterellaceae bacterium]MBA4316451.1 twin-arginine translocase subunit TatC [Alcaligenaceae bacterium]PZO15207.1 MAG: twin-arginine translocase subunit TatC [Betaproteobacteria bacterium]MBT84033.1 twin-arginine translocase subunit TatC [Sutterellaceae bacterium]MDP3270921.1 twin-arginine translocase subunit TatC [Limnobacter sp.]|tara:strand:- start:6374 stop:7111 length:738 start_codon:yes stop_codon:yes gene_type:complete